MTCCRAPLLSVTCSDGFVADGADMRCSCERRLHTNKVLLWQRCESPTRPVMGWYPLQFPVVPQATMCTPPSLRSGCLRTRAAVCLTVCAALELQQGAAQVCHTGVPAGALETGFRHWRAAAAGQAEDLRQAGRWVTQHGTARHSTSQRGTALNANWLLQGSREPLIWPKCSYGPMQQS